MCQNPLYGFLSCMAGHKISFQYAAMNPRIFWAEQQIIEPMKAPAVGAKQKKLKNILPPGTLKMHSLDFSVLSFHFKTFSKLLKFILRNTLLGRCFSKSSYIQIKYVYIHKLVRAANQFQLKRYCKYCSRNQMKQCRLSTSRRKR